MKLKDTERVIGVLRAILSEIKPTLERRNSDEAVWSKFTYTGWEEILRSNNMHELSEAAKEYSQLTPTKKLYPREYMRVKLQRPYAEKLYGLAAKAYEELKVFEYRSIFFDQKYYKFKTLYYDESHRIVYMIVSFLSKQDHDGFLAGIQKGKTGLSLGKNLDVYPLKNAYLSKVGRAKDENRGDGVHAIIFNKNVDVLRIHKGDNILDAVYDYLVDNTKTGLLPEWKEYLYNQLHDRDLIKECEGFDITGQAPMVITMSRQITTDLVRAIKQEGLRSGQIILPVEKDEKIPLNMSFLEMIQRYVLDYVKADKAYYNVGEAVNEVIASPIMTGEGETLRLYPRQQVMAMGLLNGFLDGHNALTLNGGTGVGKTYMSCKLSYAVIKERFKRESGRIIVYVQGHLVKKWQRQFRECLNPIGVFPKFIELTNFKQVKELSQKPQGLEVLILPKDKAKRSYQVQYGTERKFDNIDVYQYLEKGAMVKEKEEVILRTVKNLPLTKLKLTAKKLEVAHKKPCVLLLEQLDEKGKVVSYKGATTSDILKGIYGSSKKSYHFELSKEEYKELSKYLKEKEHIQALKLETEMKSLRTRNHHNGLVCPDCGGLIYLKGEDIFDEEKRFEYITVPPKNLSSLNKKCHNMVKADGTRLFDFEVLSIRKGELKYEVVEAPVTNPYIDSEGCPLTGEDLYKAKHGMYTGKYTVLLKECGSVLWGAYEQKGYRVANTADMLLKRFGKNSFDFLIADEAHLYNRESSQGTTFGKLAKLCRINLNMTGTLTGGKSSDLYYMFWRLYPEKMKELGFRFEDVSDFVEIYGRKKRVTKTDVQEDIYNKSGQGKTTCSGWQETAGISPLLYTNFLSGTMISRKLEELGIPMPKLKYFKHNIEMNDELRDAYEDLVRQFKDFMESHDGAMPAGSYIHGLLSYPDMPDQEPIYFEEELVANPKKIDLKGKLLPKEELLLETLRKEIKEGRSVLVYSVYSGKKGVSDRLMDIIYQAGFRVAELTSSIPLEKREAWIDDQYRKGVDVLVTNPTCVETGLDIVQYPSIYFYELSYNVKTVRQAEKRAWRPNQKRECRIYYSFYESTLQSDAVKLIGAKKKASLALEGVFSEDMLSSLGEGGESGAQILFKVLQGKVKLAEEELDAFDFEKEDAVDVPFIDVAEAAGDKDTDAPETKISETNISEPKKNTHQLNLFTIDEATMEVLRKDVKNKKKGKSSIRNIAVGQLSLFDMVDEA